MQRRMLFVFLKLNGFCSAAAICDLVHDVEAIHGRILAANNISKPFMSDTSETAKLPWHHSYLRIDFQKFSSTESRPNIPSASCTRSHTAAAYICRVMRRLFFYSEGTPRLKEKFFMLNKAEHQNSLKSYGMF